MRQILRKLLDEWVPAAILAGVIVAAVAYPVAYLLGPRQHEYVSPLDHCRYQLQSLALTAKMYAHKSRGERYPPLSTVPGRLMWSASSLTSVEPWDRRGHVCPADSNSWWKIDGYLDIGGNTPSESFWADDWSYMYLGYLLQDDEDVALFAEAYREHIVKGVPFDDIPRPNSGVKPRMLYVLRHGAERFVMTTSDMRHRDAAARAASRVPVLIERPGNHDKPGGHVAYLDGHVEWIDYPGKWPMTRETMRILRRLDALGERVADQGLDPLGHQPTWDSVGPPRRP